MAIVVFFYRLIWHCAAASHLQAHRANEKSAGISTGAFIKI